MEYTKDNYLYGKGSGESWHVNISPPRRQVKTYYEETLETVEYVYSNKTGKFTVLFSGGLDSRYVIEVLLHLKMPFDTVIIEYHSLDGEIYNQDDIKYAYEFCQLKNINPKIFKLNFDKFVESGKIVEIAESVICCSPIVSTCLHVIDQLDGFILLGNDPPYIRYEKEQNQWYLEELQYIHSHLRYFEKYNLNGCPYLLSYTPEMMLSFLIDPSIKKLGSGYFPGRLGSNSTKSDVFNNGSNFNMPSYDFKNKTRIKQHGFEKIATNSKINEHPNYKIFFEEFFPKWNGEYLEPYFDAVKRLSVFQ